MVTVAGQLIVLYLITGKVGIGSIHIGCTFELIRTTLCHGVDGTSCKPALTDIKGSGGNGNLFQCIQRIGEPPAGKFEPIPKALLKAAPSTVT